MRRLSILLAIGVIVLLVVGLVISCTPKSKETVAIRCTIAQPPQDFVYVSSAAMAERFNERAGGEYEITVYPAETLVTLFESTKAVSTGVVEMANVPWGAAGGLDPRFTSVETPFLYKNSRAMAAAQEATLGLYNSVFEEKFNQKALASFMIEPLTMISTKPLKTLEDWDGRLVGTISPISSATTECLGGSPVVVNYTESYSNLEKGVIETTFLNTIYIQIMGLTEVAKYLTIACIFPASHGYTINLDVWNTMPENIQDILIEETTASVQELNEFNIKGYEENPAILMGMGADVYYLPEAELDRWHAAVHPMVDEYLASLGEFGQELKQIADEVNAQNP